LDKTESVTPIFYMRGFNSPYSEGHIGIARNMMKALSLHRIRSIIFNYKYHVCGPKNCGNFGSTKFEQNIPLVERADIFHRASASRSKMIFSLSAETLATLKFLAIEKCIDNKRSHHIVNVVNCFRYPRIFAKRFSKYPIILHFYIRNIPLKNMVGIIADKADTIIVSSKSLANHFEKEYGVNRLKLKTIYPPLDTNVYKPVDKNRLRTNIGIEKKAKIILYMGHLRAPRFPEEIVLQMINKLIKKAPQTMLFVFSPETNDNNKRKIEILAKAKRLNLTANVKIDVRNLSEFDKSIIYSTSDIFLFPSLISTGAVEPPLTILEAMSSGLVVVSEDLLSTKEVITHGVNGLIVPFRNGEVSHLEERISSMLEDKEAISTMSGNARRSIIEKMSLDDSGRKLVDLFRSLSQ